MTQSKVVFALAAAVSFGIIQPANTPTEREVPLSKSDIVIADKGETTGGEGSTKMGGGSNGGAADQNSAAPPSSAPSSDGG